MNLVLFIAQALGVLLLTSLLLILLMLLFRLSVIRVEGDSMLPTYKTGDLVLLKRRKTRGKPIKEGQLLVLYSPSGQIIIKRVTEVADISNNEMIAPEEWGTHKGERALWVEGDNRGHDEMGNPYSRDSRSYGYVHEDAVIGFVLLPRKQKYNN